MEVKTKLSIEDVGFVLYAGKILKIKQIKSIEIKIAGERISIVYNLIAHDSYAEKSVDESHVFKNREEVTSYFEDMLDKLCLIPT